MLHVKKHKIFSLTLTTGYFMAFQPPVLVICIMIKGNFTYILNQTEALSRALECNIIINYILVIWQ